MSKRVLIVAVCAVFLVIPQASAITNAELLAADDTLRQMDATISTLRGYVQLAERGTAEGVVLTSGQKQALKALYAAEKGELVTLFNQLP